MASFTLAIVLAAVLFGVWAAPAHAFIVNGGFELGFNGWTRIDQIGSEGTFHLQTGTVSPVTGVPVPPPPEGLAAAMTDAEGPGSHVLYQDFVVPATPVGSTTLSFQLFVQNSAPDFFAPDHLDFATPDLNQQARVDILLPSADPFSVLATDVLLTAFHTDPGDPLVSGYTQFSIDVTALLNAHLNTTLRLRFAEVDNVSIFQFGVDDVRLAEVQAVPEPATHLLMLATMLGMAWTRLRL
jgi:hypothetical protein